MSTVPRIEAKPNAPAGPSNRWARGVARWGKPFARVAAARAVTGRNRSRSDPTAGRFTRREVMGFLDAAFDRFQRSVPDLAGEPTIGSRQNVMLAALTLSMLESLEESGVERAYAIELVGDICWRFYRHWGRATKAATTLASRDRVRRLQLSVNAFLTYPFGRPGYQYTDVPEPDGRSLDMLRCPVADYLAARGAADLCAGSWCNLDYALAEMWGARLQRSGTLVAGAGCCDFRFHSLSASDANPEQPSVRPLPMVAP